MGHPLYYDRATGECCGGDLGRDPGRILAPDRAAVAVRVPRLGTGRATMAYVLEADREQRREIASTDRWVDVLRGKLADAERRGDERHAESLRSDIDYAESCVGS